MDAQRREVFVPLVYPVGDLAEVDFFEVLVDLPGKMVKVETPCGVSP